MSKKIKITESQLKMLLENKKKSIKEQDYDDFDQSPEYDEGSDRDNWEDEQVFRDREGEDNHESDEGYNTPEKLLNHSATFLELAVEQNNWDMVKELIGRIREFTSENEQTENSDDQSSVINDIQELPDESPIGINETIINLRNNFKRFI